MASSIKLFQFTQKFHRFIGIHPCQFNEKKYSYNFTNTLYLIGNVQALPTTVAFLVLNAKSMFEFGFGFYMFVSFVNSFAVYLLFISKKETTYEYFGSCEEFIGKRPHMSTVYRHVIQKIELFNKFVCASTYLAILFCIFPTLPYTIIRYFIFDMGEQSYYLLYPTWWPFDIRTPFGYLVAFLGEFLGNLCAGSVYIQFGNLFFGSCWLFIFIAEDITQDLDAFNITVRISNDNYREIVKRFCDLVQLYSDAKRCVLEFNQIIQYPLFMFFTWCMLGLASILVTLQFQLWANDSNLFDLIALCWVLFWITSFLILLCEPGAKITNQLSIFGDELGQCNWYLLGIEMQRMYMIFLTETHNPMKIISYANITCERETSKTIINKAFSYFMTLRKFKA